MKSRMGRNPFQKKSEPAARPKAKPRRKTARRKPPVEFSKGEFLLAVAFFVATKFYKRAKTVATFVFH